jgi:hypothetical protein
MATENDGVVTPGATGTEGNPNPNDKTPPPGGKTGGEGGGDGKTFVFKEDRTDWVPRSRLNEESAKAKKVGELERTIAELQSQLNGTRESVGKAFGFTTPSKEEAESAELQEALVKMFPGLQAIKDLTPEQMEDLLAGVNESRSTALQNSTRHAKAMIGKVEGEIASAMNVEKLTDTQRKRIARAYQDEAHASFVAREAARTRGERRTTDTLPTDNDFLARHEAGDETLITEFVKGFLGDFFEIARRNAQASALNRNRPLPRGERTRTSVTTKLPEVDVNDPDAFAKGMRELRAARG